ncbi:MAG: SOS response-associated peptidase [Dehalobacterium sp.]
MCGRYVILDEEDDIEIRKIIQEIEDKFAGTPQREEMRTGEIFPTNVSPVLLPAVGGGFRAAPMKWGYPRWNGPGVVINARGETAGSKNMFRSSLAARRCVIPASGFFEWKGNGSTGKKKNKYLLRLPNTSIMYMAGLYNSFQEPQTGNMYEAFVIVTTCANLSVTAIHDRMPVILKPEDLAFWLSDSKDAGTLLKEEGPMLVSSLSRVISQEILLIK